MNLLELLIWSAAREYLSSTHGLGRPAPTKAAWAYHDWASTMLRRFRD